MLKPLVYKRQGKRSAALGSPGNENTFWPKVIITGILDERAKQVNMAFGQTLVRGFLA